MRLTAISTAIALTAVLAVGGCKKVEQPTADSAQPAADSAPADTGTDTSPYGTYTDDNAGKIIGIWTDTKTHCQYFLGNSIMTPRLGSDGRPICDEASAPPSTTSPDASSSPGGN